MCTNMCTNQRLLNLVRNIYYYSIIANIYIAISVYKSVLVGTGCAVRCPLDLTERSGFRTPGRCARWFSDMRSKVKSRTFSCNKAQIASFFFAWRSHKIMIRNFLWSVCYSKHPEFPIGQVYSRFSTIHSTKFSSTTFIRGRWWRVNCWILY